MARPIKFRAWDGKGMCFPVTVKNPTVTEINGHALMQLTGLKDKNGQEIFEGDVLQYESDGYLSLNLEVVKWPEGESGFGHYSVSGELRANIKTNYTDRFFKVIGNIWENPELIKAVERA